MKSKTSLILILTIFLFFSYQEKPIEASVSEHFVLPDSADFNKFLDEIQHLSPPQTILVRITGDWPCNVRAPYSLVTMDFNMYVKNVLPNEWYYWWPEESLKAGAVAVKMFAWYWIDRGGKWPDADVADNTCDQWLRFGSAHPRTDKAVDETWDWVLSRESDLFETRHKNTRNCSPPTCIQQLESADLARNGYRWDEILAHFYPGSSLWSINNKPAGYKLFFEGLAADQSNRVLIPLFEHDQKSGANLGEGDFTLEWFMKAYSGGNHSGSLACGMNEDWNKGSIIFDRGTVEHTNTGFGVSLSDGRIIVGASGPTGSSYSLCGSIPVEDGQWHHIAVQRRASDGRIWLFVDGDLDGFVDGPSGDISVTLENGYPSSNYLYIGAGRDSAGAVHPYRGWLDEIRFSKSLRYPAYGFEAPASILPVDDMTTALFRFDEGRGIHVFDTVSPEPQTTSGIIQIRSGHGPHWQLSNLFIDYNHNLYLPFLRN
jgi:hypothetical protein